MDRLLLHPTQHGFYSQTDLRPLLKMACKVPSDAPGRERESRSLSILWRFGIEEKNAFSHLIVQRFDYHRLNRFFEVVALAGEEDFGDDTMSSLCAPLLRNAGPIFDVIDSRGDVRPIQATYSQDGFCFEEIQPVYTNGAQLRVVKQTPWMSYSQLVNAITGVQYGFSPSPCLLIEPDEKTNNVDLLVDLDGKVNKALRNTLGRESFSPQGSVLSSAFSGLPIFKEYSAYLASKNVSN